MKLPADLTNKLTPVIEVFIPKKRYDVAIETLLKMKEKFKKYHIVEYYLGMCYINNHQFQDALLSFKRIKNSKQISIIQLTQTNLILGLIYTETKQFEDAERAFLVALKINPNSSMCYSALGYVYYLRKQYDVAIQNFKKALQLDPNNAGAHNNLGYTYAEIGVNLNEAVRECRKAVALNPKSGSYYDSLGWAAYSAGDYADSVKSLRKALELMPENKMIKEHLNKAMKKRDRAK